MFKENENLGVLGFTDHSAAHCTMVAKKSSIYIKDLVTANLILKW